MPVIEHVPVHDRRHSEQAGKQDHRRKTDLDRIPVAFDQHPQEEVGAAEIGRGEHHRRHGRLDGPSEQPGGLLRKEIENDESAEQEGDDHQG